MPNPLADEARAMNDRQLGEAVNEAYRELFNLQFQKGTRQLQDGLAVRRARRQIARLRTIQRERAIADVLGAPLAPSAAPAEAAVSPQKRRALEARAALEAKDVEAEEEATADAEADDAAGDDAADDQSADEDMNEEDGGPAVGQVDDDVETDDVAAEDDAGTDDVAANGDDSADADEKAD
ncbi:MAG: 50S ribosomal protein L29 [Chloroflexi bacterium]|nr:50S ribosomal protein L29 [Chloroflexota bacterium]